jgi:hypothetical protein
MTCSFSFCLRLAEHLDYLGIEIDDDDHELDETENDTHADKNDHQ